jgi:CelD/BcsL family acetyltransferase involved in cellulose biosynthesis
LETRAAGSFFQGWSWTGCRFAERFPDAWLFSAQIDGRDVALGLFNRHTAPLARHTLRLGESGQRSLDSIYVEHNGLLLAAELAGWQAAFLTDALRFLLQHAGVDRLILPGVDTAHRDAARASGAALRIASAETSRYLDLIALPPGEDGFFASRSANTRAQLRRALRAYAQRGTLRLRRADSEAEAQAMFDALGVLHQASWTARGKPGAFANPDFVAFHRDLIARGFARDEIDLLCVRAGGEVVGYLYNFRHADRVLSYQSGFDYAAASGPMKPGLAVHALAIAHYRQAGLRHYDFLAGEDRYKASLSNAATELVWLDLAPRWSPRGLLTRLRG